MSFTLFKANLKTNRFIWILLVAIYGFYAITLLSMFDPEKMDALADMMEMLPKEMVDELNFNFGSTLLTFLSGVLYSILLYLFPMILTIVVNHRLMASHIDKGSMAYLISTSNSRKKIATTQAIFSITSITAVFVVITTFIIVLSSIMFPGELEVGKFILLNIYALLQYFAISGICFFASCIARESKHSLSLGAGLSVGFLVIQMLADSAENIQWIRSFTLYTLFNPERLIAGESFAYIGMLSFLLISIALYVGGILLFSKRDLSI